jgi:hypothetical protein
VQGSAGDFLGGEPIQYADWHYILGKPRPKQCKCGAIKQWAHNRAQWYCIHCDESRAREIQRSKNCAKIIKASWENVEWLNEYNRLYGMLSPKDSQRIWEMNTHYKRDIRDAINYICHLLRVDGVEVTPKIANGQMAPLGELFTTDQENTS